MDCISLYISKRGKRSMMELMFTLAAVLGMPLIVGLETDMSTFRYVHGQIHIKPDRAYFAEMQLRSGIDCACMCSRHGVDNCSIARFLHWNGTCSLFYWKDVHTVRISQVPNSVDSDTAALYISPGQKHIYLATVQNLYSFTFVEARHYCALIGGTLGTPIDVTVSRDDGWEICACGWTNVGSAYFHVSETSGGCGTSALWRCSSQPAFGAHCLFY